MSRLRQLLVAVPLLAASACIHPHAAKTPSAVTPPTPIGSNRLTLVAPAPDTIYSVELAVDVDEQGRADLSTLQLTGSVAEVNRAIINDWLRTTRFEPAKRDGMSVRGRFRMLADAQVAVDRYASGSDTLSAGEASACSTIARTAARLPSARVRQGLDSFPAFTGRARRFGCVVEVRGPVRPAGRAPVMATSFPDSLGAGWRRDDALVADGPVRTVYGIWRGDVLCLVRVDWGVSGRARQPRRAGSTYVAQAGCEELPDRMVPRG